MSEKSGGVLKQILKKKTHGHLCCLTCSSSLNSIVRQSGQISYTKSCLKKHVVQQGKEKPDQGNGGKRAVDIAMPSLRLLCWDRQPSGFGRKQICPREMLRRRLCRSTRHWSHLGKRRRAQRHACAHIAVESESRTMPI